MRVWSEMPCLAYVITGSSSCHSLSITHPMMVLPVGPAVPDLPCLPRSIGGQGPTPLRMGACSANFSISWVVVGIVATAQGRTEIYARSGSTGMFLVHGWTSWKLYVSDPYALWHLRDTGILLSEILLLLTHMACTYLHFWISACTSNRGLALE